MLNSKNFIVFAIPYLTVVCSLFHLVYYGLFGLNGLSFISGTDIIKSAAYPLLLTFLFSAVGIFLGHKLYGAIRPKRNTNNKPSDPTLGETILKFIFFLIFWTILVAVSYFIFGQLNYIVTGFAIGNIIFGMFNEDKLISNDIGAYVDKEYLLMLLVYFPCFSIATAVQDADNILTNKSYKYTSTRYTTTATNEPNLDTLKFIGMTEQTYLFTNLKNDKIFFIKTDSLILQTR